MSSFCKAFDKGFLNYLTKLRDALVKVLLLKTDKIKGDDIDVTISKVVLMKTLMKNLR